MVNRKNDSLESTSILEIHTVESPPISLLVADDYVKCPICDIDIDVKGVVIDNGSFAHCEDCNHRITFKIVKLT